MRIQDSFVSSYPCTSARRSAKVAVLMVAFGLWFVLPSVFPTDARAFVEPNALPTTGCMACHVAHTPGLLNPAGGDCSTCHASGSGSGFTKGETSGPHGGYSSTTTKCAVCHSVHDASVDSIILLPAATIYDTCFTCHDGTQGWGVYGTIAARGGVVGGGHSYEPGTAVIPGGDPTTGGDDATRVFRGANGVLTCTDCHSPHGNELVEPFIGERNRLRLDPVYRGKDVATPDSSRLLRRRPTGAAAETLEYGSDWCLGCHAGRNSTGAVHNHPVESAANNASPYVYRNLPVLNSGGVTSQTVLGQLGGTIATETHYGTWEVRDGNLGFLMPWDSVAETRTPLQRNHYPICQQCHEDSRDVGALVGDGSSADAAAFDVSYADSVSWNGSAWVTETAGNPRYQNFPHETENYRMLVETDDDLCLNCHPTSQLP